MQGFKVKRVISEGKKKRTLAARYMPKNVRLGGIRYRGRDIGYEDDFSAQN